MRNFANYALFQAGWFACVGFAAEGSMWLGPLAVAVIAGLHLAYIARPPHRRWELAFLVGVGAAGTIADTLLEWLGATRYPTSEMAWSAFSAPPWIAALWVLFATLPCHSLSWLQARPRLAATLGAVGGPLSYLAGTRTGAVELGASPLFSLGALSVEYAIATPLMLELARRRTQVPPGCPDS